MKIDTSIGAYANLIKMLNTSLELPDYLQVEDVDIGLPAGVSESNYNTKVLITNKTGKDVLKRSIELYYNRIRLPNIYNPIIPNSVFEWTNPTEFNGTTVINIIKETIPMVDECLEYSSRMVNPDNYQVTVQAKNTAANVLYLGRSVLTVKKKTV